MVLILTSAFLAVFFMVTGVYCLLFASRIALLERLQKSTTGSSAVNQGKGPKNPWNRGFYQDFLGFLGTLGAGAFFRRQKLKDMQQKLLQAHIPMRAEELLGLSIFSGIALCCFAYLLAGNLAAALLFALLGFKIPSLYVELKRAKRLNLLTQQLPDALSIISSGLRAGFSFPQAMSVVGKEIGPPLGEEFSRVLWENRMGKPVEEALQNLGKRTGSEDLNLLITALLIQRQLGGNLAEILDNINWTIRERLRIKKEIKTLTAQGRLSAVIIILLPFAVAAILMAMNPEYMLTLFQEPLGLAMVVSAVILQLLGIFFIYKIVNIEV